MTRPAWGVILFAAVALAQPRFVRIPPGSSQSPLSGKPFWMGRTEVTVRQFEAFVKTAGYRTTAEQAGAERTWRSPGFRVSGNQPVVYVTPKDAMAYCAWIGARLPTDAEWEYAARAGATTRHFWGDAIDGRFLWYRANSGDRPRKVATRQPNAWGLYDMEGNVWEWSLSEPVKGELMANRRGGSWVDCEDILAGPGKAPAPLIGVASYFRISVNYGHRYDDIGFRCARDGRN